MVVKNCVDFWCTDASVFHHPFFAAYLRCVGTLFSPRFHRFFTVFFTTFCTTFFTKFFTTFFTTFFTRFFTTAFFTSFSPSFSRFNLPPLPPCHPWPPFWVSGSFWSLGEGIGRHLEISSSGKFEKSSILNSSGQLRNIANF